MPQLIKDRKVGDDRWSLVRDPEAPLPSGPVIVPLATWQARREALIARGDVGVWLAPADDPAALGGDVGALPVVAVDFPQFTDGRGYSIGRLLRERVRRERRGQREQNDADCVCHHSSSFSGGTLPSYNW